MIGAKLKRTNDSIIRSFFIGISITYHQNAKGTLCSENGILYSVNDNNYIPIAFNPRETIPADFIILQSKTIPKWIYSFFKNNPKRLSRHLNLVGLLAQENNVLTIETKDINKYVLRYEDLLEYI